MIGLIVSQFVSNFVRFTMVNAVSYLINLIVLPLLVNVTHMNPLIAQFLILLVTTMISFVGHKFFSFRRTK
ncbi:MAG: GtrA family protein [Leuconostoc citreum]